MHWLGADVGRRRIGLAVADEQSRLASALGTIEFPRDDFARAAAMAKKKLASGGYAPEACVLGWPTHANGEPGETAQAVQAFRERMRQHFPEMRFFYQDEHGTTVAANALLADAGLKASVRGKAVDSVSAVVILQAYLDAN